MESAAQLKQIFNNVEDKLSHEINVLQDALSKIDRHSDDPGDQWVYPIYERIIERRKKLLAYLSA